MRRTRSYRRDADSPVSVRRAVPLPRFRREVVALLMAARVGARRLDSTQALRLVIRWDRMVRLRHSQGKPPCNVVDHILRYERDQAVCPCGNPLPSPINDNRDPSTRRGGCRRCSRQGARGSRRDPGQDLELRQERTRKSRYEGPWLLQVRNRHSEKWRTIGAPFDDYRDAQSVMRERMEKQVKIVRPRGGDRG